MMRFVVLTVTTEVKVRPTAYAFFESDEQMHSGDGWSHGETQIFGEQFLPLGMIGAQSTTL